jgi:very-short-patch-repair endonuclease
MVRELRKPRRVKSIRAPRRGVSTAAVREEPVTLVPRFAEVSEAAQELAHLEERAVSVAKVYGTILERIVWQSLTDKHIPFSFQSSLIGGRYGYQFGRQVADFALWQQRIVIECQGTYWHAPGEQWYRDLTRELILSAEGWTTIYLEQRTIVNETELDNWLNANVIYSGLANVGFTVSQSIGA